MQVLGGYAVRGFWKSGLEATEKSGDDFVVCAHYMVVSGRSDLFYVLIDCTHSPRKKEVYHDAKQK